MSNKLYDPIRHCELPSFPEEKVRQKLIKKMIGELKFPKSLIAVEKDLKSLPHLLNVHFSSNKRRADIICFAKGINDQYELFPLLLIECKAIKLTQKAIDQVLGYNHFVKAYFTCIANDKEIKTYWFDFKKKKYEYVDFLPSYDQLMKAVEK